MYSWSQIQNYPVTKQVESTLDHLMKKQGILHLKVGSVAKFETGYYYKMGLTKVNSLTTFQP